MGLYDRFELLDLDRDGGVQSYTAREIATGLPVKVHLFVRPGAPLQRALLQAIDQLPESDKGHVIERGEHEGTPYLVTDRLTPHPGLREWLHAVSRAVDRAARPAASSAAKKSSRRRAGALPKKDKLLALIPPGGSGDYVLEMNGQTEITPLLETRLGYGHVRGCVDTQGSTAASAIDRFDFERDFYPYPNAHFKAIICCELLETLTQDPMHMLDEIHRILRPGCHLILTTRRLPAGQVSQLLENCGLEVTVLETEGDLVYASARKTGPVRERYPAWLYPDRA